jgi:hypothetical protein
MHTITLEIRELDPDAPTPPAGLQPKPGVEYGCGDPQCADCYEPATPFVVVNRWTVEED